MRRVRDRHLPTPFRAWIDRAESLPPGVVILPRTVNVSGDLWPLVYIGCACLAMGGFLAAQFQSLLNQPDAGVLAGVAFTSCILVGIPLWMAYQLWRTIGASRDQKAGALRQGVLVGPAGVLVRLTPNLCYPIPVERFVTANEWNTGGEDRNDWLTIETKDGPVNIAAELLTVGATAVNEAVVEARRHRTGRGT